MSGWLWAPTSSDSHNPDGTLNAAFFNSTPAVGVAAEPVWQEPWLGPGNNTSAGGKSSIYATPAWQAAQTSLTGGSRGIPDLSWNAAVNGGVLVYITAFPNAIRPGWHVTGGTSAASPQIAGLLAWSTPSAPKMAKRRSVTHIQRCTPWATARTRPPTIAT